MRQSVKLGIATVTATVALFGGAPTASAYAQSGIDPGECDGTSTSQVTCQFGDDDENITIYQTFTLTNVSTGDINDVTFGPDLV
jgi:hypothetical protein